jgi:uncharacterized protein
MLTRFYDKVILAYPKSALLLILTVIGFLGYQAQNLIIDASAETLILEDDKDLRYARFINSRYGIHDFLIITYTPRDDLLSEKTLTHLKRLRDELSQLEGVTSVTSMLDVPLLESPRVPIKDLVKNIQTLESPSVDRDLAREEFINSPIYRNLLVNPNFTTTALQVNLPVDGVYRDLVSRRDELRTKKKTGILTSEERAEYKQVLADFRQHREKMRKRQHNLILEIRAVVDKHQQDADLFLGGVSMIADDLVTFVKNDLKVFGLGVLVFLIITLLIIFRQIRWILLPLVCVVFSAVAMMGLLGLFGWEVTVISSNFISLQLIMTMAFTVHLIVRYRELLHRNPDAAQRELILDTVNLMAQPCLFSALTTAAGFGSLLLSGILPVITFGWMMSAGIIVSLILTFLIFPSVVILLDKKPPNRSFESHFPLTKILARYTQNHGTLILVVSGVTLIISIAGISRLVVENSFINYFKDTTEIYQGMKLIDQQLGGTTPLDLVMDLEEPEELPVLADSTPADIGNDEFEDEFATFEGEFDEAKDEAKYWFTSDKMDRVKKIHNYLDSIPETGKVFSLATMLKVGEKLNDGKHLDDFDLALIYSEMPEEFRGIVLTPYVSVEHNQVRFSIRVRDSEETLRRNELLKMIERDLTEKMGIKKENVHLTGPLVLYNNLLQSLFSSQILTLGAVVAALLIMFMILFRSLVVSLIAIFPNLLSIGVVLGFMGWMNIPLDMMTITIAAISVGIAVDNTIHYIHRFKREFKSDRNYVDTMHRCHGSIGYAMYYTSMTIIIGFSILVLSNFIPTIYFGFLTGLAMFIALIAALTLLPQLIVWIKPLGPEGVTRKLTNIRD